MKIFAVFCCNTIVRYPILEKSKYFYKLSPFCAAAIRTLETFSLLLYLSAHPFIYFALLEEWAPNKEFVCRNNFC